MLRTNNYYVFPSHFFNINRLYENYIQKNFFSLNKDTPLFKKGIRLMVVLLVYYTFINCLFTLFHFQLFIYLSLI